MVNQSLVSSRLQIWVKIKSQFKSLTFVVANWSVVCVAFLFTPTKTKQKITQMDDSIVEPRLQNTQICMKQ